MQEESAGADKLLRRWAFRHAADGRRRRPASRFSLRYDEALEEPYMPLGKADASGKAFSFSRRPWRAPATARPWAAFSTPTPASRRGSTARRRRNGRFRLSRRVQRQWAGRPAVVAGLKACIECQAEAPNGRHRADFSAQARRFGDDVDREPAGRHFSMGRLSRRR